jgi:DNA-binding XRE family transcriptional regulator
MFRSNHADLLALSQKHSRLSKKEFAEQLGVSRFTCVAWRKKNFIPEVRREQIAKLSNGVVDVKDFYQAWDADETQSV